MQRLPLDGMSPDYRTFGTDGVAQAGHELHVPLAEPGVCGLAVDKQLEASGAVRVALQADLGIRDVEAVRILRGAEFARDVEGLHGDNLAGARLRDSHVAAVFAPAEERLRVGQPVFDAVELCLQLLFGLLMSGLLLAVGTVQRSDLFVQGGVFRVEAVDLLLLPLDTRGADHRPDPLDDVRSDLRRGVFQPGTLQLALHTLQLGLGACPGEKTARPVMYPTYRLPSDEANNERTEFSAIPYFFS